MVRRRRHSDRPQRNHRLDDDGLGACGGDRHVLLALLRLLRLLQGRCRPRERGARPLAQSRHRLDQRMLGEARLAGARRICVLKKRWRTALAPRTLLSKPERVSISPPTHCVPHLERAEREQRAERRAQPVGAQRPHAAAHSRCLGSSGGLAAPTTARGRKEMTGKSSLLCRRRTRQTQ